MAGDTLTAGRQIFPCDLQNVHVLATPDEKVSGDKTADRPANNDRALAVHG